MHDDELLLYAVKWSLGTGVATGLAASALALFTAERESPGLLFGTALLALGFPGLVSSSAMGLFFLWALDPGADDLDDHVH